MANKKRFDVELAMLAVASVVAVVLSLAIFTVVIDRRLSSPLPFAGFEFQLELSGPGSDEIRTAICAILNEDGAQLVKTATTRNTVFLKGASYVGYRNPALARPSAMDVVFSEGRQGGLSVFVNVSPIEAVRDGSGFRPLRDEMIYLLAKKASDKLRAQLHGREGPTPYIIHGMP